MDFLSSVFFAKQNFKQHGLSFQCIAKQVFKLQGLAFQYMAKQFFKHHGPVLQSIANRPSNYVYWSSSLLQTSVPSIAYFVLSADPVVHQHVIVLNKVQTKNIDIFLISQENFRRTQKNNLAQAKYSQRNKKNTYLDTLTPPI